ncbi:MAG: type IX secretion system membrane protein PorP/SprF [Opitutaceae bacterium]|nr:type IX secretion system membrane protein PorP/SprF [Cytophagales bacterium]
MRNRRFFVVILFLPFGQLLAQDNFSEAFFYFNKNIQLHMPSGACAENDFEGNIAYRTYPGKLAIIRSYYADANFNLRKKEFSTPGNSKHVVGLGFYNDREGDFFTRARVLSRYAIHIPVSEEMYLSAGASFHLINYNFSASGTGASGSAWTWSGGIGTTLYSPTFKLGVSLNDFNSPNLRPVNFDFTIPRYLTLYGEKSQEVAENVSVNGASKLNLQSRSVSCILKLGLAFYETVGISGLYYVNKGIGAAFELNKIKLHNGLADLSFTYLIPGQKVSPSVSQYEINMRFSIDK